MKKFLLAIAILLSMSVVAQKETVYFSDSIMSFSGEQKTIYRENSKLYFYVRNDSALLDIVQKEKTYKIYAKYFLQDSTIDDEGCHIAYYLGALLPENTSITIGIQYNINNVREMIGLIKEDTGVIFRIK